jgi:hypothetical protein
MGTTQIYCARNSGYFISLVFKVHVLSFFLGESVSTFTNTTCQDIVLFLDLDEIDEGE